MEYAIGEIITLPDGRKAEVVEEIVKGSCHGCLLETESCDALSTGHCNMAYRSDHKNVIFKEIKD